MFMSLDVDCQVIPDREPEGMVLLNELDRSLSNPLYILDVSRSEFPGQVEQSLCFFSRCFFIDIDDSFHSSFERAARGSG